MSDSHFDLVDAKDSFMDTDWFYACKKAQTPYVVVRSGESSADVLWDFVTLPLSCDSTLHEKFNLIERDARAIFDRFAVKDSYARIKPTMICFDHLPVDDAKRAAQELYGLITSYLPKHSPSERRAEILEMPPSKPQEINRPRKSAEGDRMLWIEQGSSASSAA